MVVKLEMAELLLGKAFYNKENWESLKGYMCKNKKTGLDTKVNPDNIS